MIIDVHTHYGFQFFPMHPPGKGDFLRALDRYGIDIALVSSADGIFYDCRQCNADLLDAIRGHEDRLRGYVVVNPNYRRDALEQIDRYTALPQFAGVKLHASWHDKPIDGPEFEPLFARCEELGLPVLLHSYVVDDSADQVSSPDRIMNVAKRHKNPLIIAHMGGNSRRMIRAVAAAGNPDHVYIDISTGRESASQLYAWQMGRVDEAVAALGAGKVLFGTDFPPLDPAICFGMIEDSGLTPQEKERVLWKNAAELFRLG